MRKITLLSGPRGVGKSTTCQRLAELVQSQGLHVGGVVAPPCLNSQGIKTGSDIVSLSTGDRRHLADIDRSLGAGRTIGSYRIDALASEWALERVLLDLESALDLVVIDEIGRWEMLKGGGFAPALSRLATSKAQYALLVVRQSAIEWTRDQLAETATELIVLNETNRDQAAGRLLLSMLSN